MIGLLMDVMPHPPLMPYHTHAPDFPRGGNPSRRGPGARRILGIAKCAITPRVVSRVIPHFH
jgi:hypothetical protein